MRQALVFLLLPPAGPLLLALFGLLLWGRLRPWRWWVVGTGLALAWAFSTPRFVDPLIAAWAGMPTAQQTAAQLAPWAGRPRTVVLVLGGGVAPGLHAQGGYDLKTETLERLRRGVWWSRELNLPLAFTGGTAPSGLPDEPTEAAVAQLVARDEFRQPLAWVEDESVNTQGNAVLSAKLLKQHRIERVVLVTHGPHMPRALRAFRAASPDVTFVPAPVMREPSTGWRWPELLPSAPGVARGRYLAYEVVGYLAGR